LFNYYSNGIGADGFLVKKDIESDNFVCLDPLHPESDVASKSFNFKTVFAEFNKTSTQLRSGKTLSQLVTIPPHLKERFYHIRDLCELEQQLMKCN